MTQTESLQLNKQPANEKSEVLLKRTRGDHTIPILLSPDQNENNRSNPFAHLLGELQYIINAT